MAFESQLAVQRGFTGQRASGEAITLRVYESKQKNKGTQLSVRIPLSIYKAAGFEGKRLDIFFDHEASKVMIAPSLAGLAFTLQAGKSAYRDFVFAKGFTPDFGTFVPDSHEIVAHGGEKGILFDYDPLTMVSGRNALPEGAHPTRAQAVAATVLSEHRKKQAEGKAALAELPKVGTPAPIAPAAEPQSTVITLKPGEEGQRRTFSDEEKQKAVQVFCALRINNGKGFDEAAKIVGVQPSVMRRWYGTYGKAAERLIKRGAAAEKNRNVNGAASVAHVAKRGVKTVKEQPHMRH